MNFVVTSVFIDYDKLTGNETLKVYALNDLLVDEFNIKQFILKENRFHYFPSSLFDVCPKYLKELEANIANELEFFGHNLKHKDDLVVNKIYYKEREPTKIFKQVMLELKIHFFIK